MSRSRGRLRLTFSEDGDATPVPSQQVVMRQRVFWVMLLGAFLALICLSAYRGMLLDQVSGVLTRRPPEWELAGVALSGVKRAPIRRVLEQHPGDRDLQLGAMLVGEWRNSVADEQEIDQEVRYLDSSRLRYLRQLAAQYPRDPAVIATYLRYCTIRAVRIQRAEIEKKSNSSLVPPAVLAQFTEYCVRGEKLDPDNGYFPTLLAVARIGAGDDAEALVALHRASLATRWTDYAEAEMAGGQALLIQAYGDRGPALHAGPAAGILLPHLSQVRLAAQLAVLRADQYLAQGKLERGHAIHADVVRLGSLIAKSSRYLIGRLVGGAVRAMGLGAASGIGQPHGTTEAQKAAVRADRQKYADRVAREATAFAAEIQRANREQDLFQTRREELLSSPSYLAWDELLHRLAQREILGLSLAANLGVSLLLWGTAALLVTLSWPRGGERQNLLGWLRSHASPSVRVSGFSAAGVALVGATFWAWQGDAVGGLLIPTIGLSLLLAVGSSREDRAPSALSLAAIAAGVLGLAACLTFPWPIPELRIGWWHDTVPSVTLLGEFDPDRRISNSAFASWLPSGILLALALPAVVVSFSFFGRGSVAGAVERLRLVAKGLAGVLAVSYLVYLLAAVPANQQEGRHWDQLVEREAQGYPL